MAVAPEIKTKFTMEGLKEVASKLRAFSRNVKTQFDSISKNTSKVFKPPLQGLVDLEKKTKDVGQATLKVGARGAFAGVKIGAIGAGIAVGALALKITAVGVAAVKASQDTAASLNSIAKDARRTGASTEDISLLGFAGERSGVDRDEIVMQINTLGNEFLTVRESIAKASGEYQSFLSMTAKDVGLAARLRNGAGVQDIVDGFSTAALEARKGSLTDIQRRIAEIESASNQMSTFGSRMNGVAGDAARLVLEKERAELQAAADQIKASFGTQGQALFQLSDYGLDVDRASKGGVDGLLAISEAFQRVENPSERARIAMRLFGEDAGTKMIPLLEGGQTAIEEYRRELERLGGVVSASDAALGESFTDSTQDLKTAIGGVKLEIARNLLPYLIETNISLTEWMVKSRVAIAENVTGAFLALRTFGQDVVSIFNGDLNDIETGWLDTTIKKILQAKKVFDVVWKDITKQFILLSNGQDSDYKWINVIRDGLIAAKLLAVDLFEIFTGGNATEFKWLNTLRDNVLFFRDRLLEAFELFKTVLAGIRDAVKPIFEFFDIDVTTGLLFIGLLRISGVIGLVTTAFGILKGAIGGVVGMGAGLLGLTGTLIKFIAATGRVVAAGARGGLAGAFSAATAVEVGAVTAAVGGLTAATTNLAGKTPAVGIAAKAAAAAQADWYRSATPATASLTTRIGEMIAKIPLIGTAFQAVGSKFGGVFGGMTKGFLGLSLTIGGVISGIGTLIATATSAFAAGGAVAAYMNSGVQGAQDDYNKAQAGLIAANDHVYQRKILRTTDDANIGRRNTARQLLGQKGTEQTADEKFLKWSHDWDLQTKGRLQFTGPDAVKQYREAYDNMGSGVPRQAETPKPAATFQYNVVKDGRTVSGTGDLGMKRVVETLARGY